MGLERKFTLNDLTLINAAYKRGQVLKETKQYVLVQYEIAYKEYLISAQVREYPNMKFVTKMDFLKTAENKDEILSKMLRHLHDAKEVKGDEIKEELNEGHFLNDSFEEFVNTAGIVAKLSWNRTFRNLCFLFTLAGVILSIIYGIIPFAFLALAGIDGFILSYIWKRRILCG